MENEKSADLQTGLGAPPAGGTVQIGTVVAYFGKNIPQDWLLCDGSAIPGKYTQLMAMVGANTPNLAGRTLLGSGTNVDAAGNSGVFNLGSTGGEYQHILKETEMPSHQHFGWGEGGQNPWGGTMSNSQNKGFKGSGKSDTDNFLYGSSFAGGDLSNVTKIPVNNDSIAGTGKGATQAHNNMQPYFVINYMIYAGTN